MKAPISDHDDLETGPDDEADAIPQRVAGDEGRACRSVHAESHGLSEGMRATSPVAIRRRSATA